MSAHDLLQKSVWRSIAVRIQQDLPLSCHVFYQINFYKAAIQKHEREMCWTTHPFLCPPHPVCAGKSATAAPTEVVVLGSLACRLWAFCVCELMWVLILLLCSQTLKLLTFQLSMAVHTWLSVMFHFTDLIGFYWYSKSNKCTVSKILQILLLLSFAHPQPAVSDRQRKMARKQLGSWACPD